MKTGHPRIFVAVGLLLLALGVVVNGYRFSHIRDAQLSRENDLKAKVDEYEDLLKLQQRRFGMVMDSSPVGVVVCDQKGVITAANKTLADMLGYKQSELLGKQSSVLVADGFRDVHVAYMGKAAEKFTANKNELKLHFSGNAKRKDGSEVHVSVACRDFLVDGSPEFVVFIRPDDVSKEPIFETLRNN